MEYRLMDSRIFNYVLIFGLAIVFLAIVMLFLGTNAQAVVIVDLAGGGDYLTIQEGVDNAVPGETVYVWDGTYNENITIDKSLHLIGNGSATTIIDGFGTNSNIINLTAEGVEITGFNITESGTWYGIWTIAGGFNIHDNVFVTQNYAIYVDIYHLNTASVTVGDMTIQNNDFNGTHGIYFDRMTFENPQMGSDISVGNTIITDNFINITTGYSIAVEDCVVVNMTGGSITWGNIEIMDNDIVAPVSTGVYFKGNLVDLTDVNVLLGDIDISSNDITSAADGIFLDFWELNQLYSTTTINCGSTTIYNNDIESNTQGINVLFEDVGYDMYDSSSVSIGDVTLDQNTIDTSSGTHGIFIELLQNAYNIYNDSMVTFGDFFITSNNISSNQMCIHFVWDQVGYNMNGNSHVSLGETHVDWNNLDRTSNGMAVDTYPVNVGNQMYDNSFLTYGNWYVDNNVISSSGGGIYTGHEYVGYEMWDNSQVIFSDYFVRDNSIKADTSQGLYIGYYDCGESMWDYAMATGGNFLVSGNNASSSSNYGYYLYYDYMGYDMYDGTYASFGWVETSNNNFSSSTNHAAYIEIYYLGAYMYGNSQAYIDDISIVNNEFWSTNSDGLYYYEFYENAYEMYDYSYVRIGDILVNDNYINAGSNGIYLDTWYDNAYHLNQHANADFGNFEFNRNTIEAGGNGIYMNYIEYWAYDLYFDNHVTMGHWQFNDNMINVTAGTGIYIVDWYDVGAYMHGTSTFTMGNFEVLRNTVNAYGDDGIYVYIRDLAYYNYGNSWCHFGDFLINDNIVNSTRNGIDVSDISYLAYYMYDNSYAEFGNFEVNNNDIIAGYGSVGGYDGIHMYFYENGYEMYGNSEAYFGHLQINDNIITCEDGSGIYFDEFYEIGSYLYDNSYFEIGNVEVCRNWIDSNSEGIYLYYIYELAYYNYDNSQAHFGDFLFNENNITAGGDGIYADYLEYWGYDMYNSADAYFGDVEFNNNTINASAYGIEIENLYYWGYDLYGDNEVILGHVQVNDNDVLATGGDGIYVDYFYDIGSDMYQTSYFQIENFEICRNTINASGDGLEMYEIDELAYEMYDNSVSIFGSFLFNDNMIISGSYGFYNYYIEYLAYDMYDQTYAEFGNFEFNNNIINAVDYGMYWEYGFYENAYYMEDSSRCIMGHYQINDNMINVSNGDGIYFDEWYDVGAYMIEDAFFEMGNLEVCRNTINATGYGIYWDYFEDVAYYMGYRWGIEYPGYTTFIMGDILFNDNVIIAYYEGIYLYDFEYLAYEMYGNAYAEFGNFEVCRNHITITGLQEGIYLYEWYEWAYYMYDNSQAVFGSILVNDNNITSGDDGIYMYEWYDMGVYMYDQTSASFGNFEMCRNVINSTDDGIYIDNDIEDLAYYNYGSSMCRYGDFLWNDNMITAGYGTTSGYGIYIDYFEYLGCELYDQSDAYFGNFEFNRNIINSYDDGIAVWNEDWGYYLTGSNEVIFGHVQFNDNEITAINGDGIYVYHYEIGIYMEQNSYFWIDNFEICRNQITAGNESNLNNHGIDVDVEYLAYDNEDSAWCHYGDFLFNDNVIEAWGYGIYVEYLEYLGAYLCDSNLVGFCYAEFGNIEFNRNQITSWDDGFYVSDWEYWGYELYGDSQVHFGHIQINDNTIKAGNATKSSEGMYFSDGPAYDFAADMYDSSYVTFGNHEICRNIINATDHGMELSYYEDIGYDMHDSARAEFQNFLVSENEITAGGYGIYIYYFGYDAAYMYDESFFIMGNFHVNDNIVLAGLATSYSGIELDTFEYNGYEMYQNAHAEVGSIEVCRNWVNTTEDGIYIYANYWGANIYGNSYFHMDNWYVNDNTVVFAGDNGMYLEFEYFANNLYGYSQSYIGNLEVLHNSLNATGDNCLEVWWANYALNNLYYYARGEVGDCFIQYNDVISWYVSGSGIYAGWDYPTYGVYDEAQAYLGDYHITHNTVYSAGNRGIDIYHDGLGIDLDNFNFVASRSVVEVGSTWVTDNTITAPQGDGLFFLIGYVGYDVYYYSTVTVGGFHIERNIITCMNNGIYMDMDDNGESVFDDAMVMVGPVIVNDNDVSSTNGTGIFLDANNIATGVNNDANVWLGDFLVTNNDILASDIGILYELRNSVSVADNAFLRVPGFVVTGNVVDSGLSALNYTTILTPGTVGATTVLELGDVLTSSNSFDGGIFGMAFEWQDPVPSVPQPIFRISYNDVLSGASSSTGVYMKNIESAFIETLNIDNFDQGIYVNNSNIWFMFNSTITNTASFDVNLTSDSFIGAVNCTFDQSDVFFEDYDSLLKVGWFMNVLVITPAGYGIPEANVIVEDVYTTMAFDGVTDPIGRTFYIVCWEYTENITGIIDNYNDYTADGNKAGVFGSATPNPTMDQSKLVIIILGDVVPPTVFGDTSDTAGTTGDPFNFGINASDNFGLYSVHVNYRYGTSGSFANLTMSGTGPYWRTINLRSDYIGPMQYYFSVQDVGGYWVSTSTTSVPITDNDAPTILSDNSNTTATTGDTFEFNVDAIDNIGVTEAHVVWWFGTGSPVDDAMFGTGPYNFTIDVPSGSLDALHYYFRITDLAGNWLVGPQVDIDVTDNDPPTLNADNSDTFADLGETFTFNVDIRDNIGMDETRLIYWFGTESPINVTMNGTGPYTYEITIPSDVIYKLHYYIMASDLPGNLLIGPQVDVNITDKIAPTDLIDTSDTLATTGDSFNFEVNATDNIGVSEAHIVYWFGTGMQTNATMTGTGPFTLEITIPSDSLDTLHYYFAITDEAGNWLIGPQVDVSVMDNDAPTLISDDSDTSAITGGDFTFNLDATDNIGVFNAYVIYWFNSQPETNSTMAGTGPYIRTITIPAGSSGTMHYYFVIIDAAGNRLIGTQTDVDVAFGEAPTFVTDNSDTSATTGDSFEFNATAEYPVDLTEVRVVYWFGTGTPTNATMTGTYTYDYGITIPSDTVEMLHYYFTAMDSHGNWLVGKQVDVPVTDNDMGSLFNDASDTSGNEDKEFKFQIDASDNVGVSQVMAAYWFGDDESRKSYVLLTSEDGTYSGTIIPRQSGTMHYYFILTDDAGNTLESSENTVSIASKPAEEEGVDWLPWILVIILVLIILLLLFLLFVRKKEEAEEITKPEAIAPPEEIEAEGEEVVEPEVEAEEEEIELEELEGEPEEELEEEEESEEGPTEEMEESEEDTENKFT